MSSSVATDGAVEIDRRRRHRRWTHTPQITFSSGGTTTDGSVYFSDSGEEQATFRPNGSHVGECGVSEGEVDLESGELERKVHSYYRKKRRRKKKRERGERDEKEDERECRICHLNLMERNGDAMEENDNGGAYIQLGCDCKGDLGAAHKRCAETWFKIRGNM